MRTLEYIPLPFLDDNYAWLITDGMDAIVVDPGMAQPVIDYCDTRRLTLTGILLTHRHADNVGGVSGLLEWSSEHYLPVFGPAAEAIDSVTVHLGDQSRVVITKPKVEAIVIAVPGHTKGHIAFYQSAVGSNPPHLFSGDTLFASGCGRLLEGTSEEMLCSLDMLADLPSSTLIHCAHEYTLSNIRFSMSCEPGNRNITRWSEIATALRRAGKPTVPTTIEHERAVNPFLRVHEREIRDMLIDTFNVPVPHRLTAFILLRAWRDFFNADAGPQGNRWISSFQQT